ncbi:alkaline phosphatase family protein [Desulfovibrio sp. OttesenSCG-928-C06]|nr:alkaline phosphatase family protein [Desulfovibrio sp. OttesenSCG-928-C06]
MRLQANGRDYAFPASPLVVLCLNGTDYRYIEAAVASGQAPFLAHLLTHCGCAEVNAVLPSLATPNNASIITGCPPSVHGICGNSFINPENGLVTPMDDPAFLRAETVLAAASRSGARVAAVSAKEKLRPMLAHGHDGICFSAETAASAWFEFRRSSGESQRVRAADFAGAPEPDVYSAELSLFALRAGAGLLQELRPDIMYLSTSDTIQHHYAPGSPEANMFFALLDPWLRRLD